MRVLQIIPASGAIAVFSDGDELPVLCWQLVEYQEEDGATWQAVVGLVLQQGEAILSAASDLEGFVGYQYRIKP
jgi:hypothetical protein